MPARAKPNSLGAGPQRQTPWPDSCLHLNLVTTTEELIMKSNITRSKQSGFFAVGLGLALAATFGVFAATVETTAPDRQPQSVERSAPQDRDVAYQESSN